MSNIREETNMRAHAEAQLKVQIEANNRMSHIMVRQGKLSSQEAGRRKERRARALVGAAQGGRTV